MGALINFGYLLVIADVIHDRFNRVEIHFVEILHENCVDEALFGMKRVLEVGRELTSPQFPPRGCAK